MVMTLSACLRLRVGTVTGGGAATSRAARARRWNIRRLNLVLNTPKIKYSVVKIKYSVVYRGQ
jgi:hypothetical protein